MFEGEAAFTETANSQLELVFIENARSGDSVLNFGQKLVNLEAAVPSNVGICF